ncbi:head decoration protein [Cellulomonas palmilytica]|uniref:head decoration protein n=1 Tax=Cellulomonas palmilytica TaxID=2608402 RepID=UPI001F3E9393|nr:head decoration protein [Cellulomonas palmilytica]
MPRLTTETFGGGDLSWLGSTHGINDARTEILDISTFTAGTHYPNGYIPAGLPVAKVGGVLVPYDATEGTTTGAGILAGFVLTDQKVVGTADFAVPLIDHGRIRTAKLPIAFTAPAAAAKRAATTFVFI